MPVISLMMAIKWISIISEHRGILVIIWNWQFQIANFTLADLLEPRATLSGLFEQTTTWATITGTVRVLGAAFRTVQEPKVLAQNVETLLPEKFENTDEFRELVLEQFPAL